MQSHKDTRGLAVHLAYRDVYHELYLAVSALLTGAEGGPPVEMAGDAAATVAAGDPTASVDTLAAGAAAAEAAGMAAGLAAVALRLASQMSRYAKELLPHGELKLLPCNA